MKAVVDVEKLYAAAFDRLDRIGRFLDELMQLRASRAGGNGSAGDVERPSAEPGEGDEMEDTGRIGVLEDPVEDEAERR